MAPRHAEDNSRECSNHDALPDAIELSHVGLAVPGPDGPLALLSDVTVRVEPGSWLAITGASGGGKSTLLNVIGLLARPTEGTYLLEGNDVSQMPERELVRARAATFGYVFQSFHLLDARSVVENVEMGLMYNGVPSHHRQERALEAIDAVGLSHRAAFNVRTLSGGERQRVAIARAIGGTRRILLCDEPTGSLDSRSSRTIMELLKELHSGGSTIVMVTHDRAIAEAAPTRIEVSDGRVRELVL